MAFCDRQHHKFVDFEASRFVVRSWRGFDIPGQHLEHGDEVPRGALPARTLMLEYKARHIETVQFAAKDSELREACARRGVDLGQPVALRHSAPKQELVDELNAMKRSELLVQCLKYGVSSDGSKADIIQRLLPLVG